MGDEPEIRIVKGEIVKAPGVGPVAQVWLPQNGKVIAKFPPSRTNRGWLHGPVGIRSPQLDGHRWHLPRSCLTRLTNAAIDRYGYVAVWRDMSKLSHCNKACLEATGLDCDCSCLGVFHGEGAHNWHERVDDAMVADNGEVKRTVVLYGGKTADGGPTLYNGELAGRQYCVGAADRKRRGWPMASEFMCGGCLTSRARVWDHCHTHGFVRAPLCNRCNTRTWSGWKPANGRTMPTRNLDTTYYQRCPKNGTDPQQRCSP